MSLKHLQFNEILSFLSFAFLLTAIPLSLRAQEVKVNEKGERIVVFPDGSWRPYQAADSVLMNKVSEFLLEDDQEGTPFEIPAETKDKKNKRPGKKNTASESRKKLSTLQLQLEEVTAERIKLENKYRKFSQDPSIPTIEIEELGRLLDQKLNEETQLKQMLAEAGIRPGTADENKSVTTAPENRDQAQKYMELPSSGKASSTRFPVRKDLMTAPPERVFGVRSVTVDEFSRRKRTDLESGIFFTHTDPKLRSMLRSEQYMTCKAYLSQLGSNVYLNLEIRFISANARREYGAIQQGSVLMLRLLNGENLSLICNSFDAGYVDPGQNTTRYLVQYGLNKEQQKLLKKYETDKARLVWTTGYEDYEIYDIRFLMDQLTSLDRLR